MTFLICIRKCSILISVGHLVFFSFLGKCRNSKRNSNSRSRYGNLGSRKFGSKWVPWRNPHRRRDLRSGFKATVCEVATEESQSLAIRWKNHVLHLMGQERMDIWERGHTISSARRNVTLKEPKTRIASVIPKQNDNFSFSTIIPGTMPTLWGGRPLWYAGQLFCYSRIQSRWPRPCANRLSPLWRIFFVENTSPLTTLSLWPSRSGSRRLAPTFAGGRCRLWFSDGENVRKVVVGVST